VTPGRRQKSEGRVQKAEVRSPALITESMKYWTVLDVTLSILVLCHPERSEGSLQSKILRRRTPQNISCSH
jgi:hypothetical protein